MSQPKLIGGTVVTSGEADEIMASRVPSSHPRIDADTKIWPSEDAEAKAEADMATADAEAGIREALGYTMIDGVVATSDERDEILEQRQDGIK